MALAFDAHINGGYSTVLTAPSPASSGTSLVVQASDGTRFPATPFNAIVWPAGTQPLYANGANAEVVRVTNIATDTFTITRAQESSSARSIVVGDQIADAETAKTFTDIEAVLLGTSAGAKLDDAALMGNVFMSKSSTQQNIALTGSRDYQTLSPIRVGSTQSLTIPGTSSLQVLPTPQVIPTGVIWQFGGPISPSGWLLCDGTAYSRTTYANLFAAIKDAYGTGDGSTTFNVPDLRGRSPVGAGTGTASGATAQTLGSQPTTGSGGEQTHTMTTGELVAHVHGAFSPFVGSGGSNLYPGAGSNMNTNGNTSSTGSTTPFNILQPMSVVNFIIKT